MPKTNRAASAAPLRSALLLVSGLFVSLLFGVSAVHAAAVADQSQTTGTTYAFGAFTTGGTKSVCQSFVPAASDISGIDFMLGTYGTYVSTRNVEVFLTTGNCKGGPGAQVVLSHQLTSAEYDSVSGGTSSPLSVHLLHWSFPTIPVTPGATYYLGVRQIEACQDCLATLAASGNPYASGTARYGTWNDAFSDQSGVDLWFREHGTTPPGLTGLAQFDVLTPLAESATSTHDSVVFKGTVTSPVTSQAKLQVELKPFGTAFDCAGILESAFVPGGSVARIGSGVLSNGQYHWRARTVDSQGIASIEDAATFIFSCQRFFQSLKVFRDI